MVPNKTINNRKLKEFIKEYSERNVDNKYKPVAVGRYGIRTRESIYSKELAKDYSNNKLIRKDTLTVGMGSKQIDIGILTDDVTYSVSPAYHTFKIRGINCDYLKYCLSCKNSEMFEQYVKKSARQGKTIDFERWLDYEIPVYENDFQLEIVNKLDAIKEIIKVEEKRLELLDELIKSRFIEMFGDLINKPKFESIPLKSICLTLSGGTPTTKHPGYYQGDIPWITTVQLGPNFIDGSNPKSFITQEAIDNSATHLIPANNILFGTRVGVGKSSINTEAMCTNQDINAIININTEKWNLLFVKNVLDQYQPHFDQIKKGATILGITTEDLKAVGIPNVEKYIQDEFATFVKQIDKSKFILHSKYFL